ncbi:MAG: carbonate dehydratase [Candidatus Accumulibacter sp. 66-26]|nr:MAG: carbonate dehydratase [Candidatus Accumulibacter sp. 66-26]
MESVLERGLSDADADARRARYGANRITPKAGKGPLLRFLLQFAQPLVLVLLLAGAVTALLGEWVDAGVIFGVTLINAVFGFVQEGRAERALGALARSLTSEVTALRGGARRRLPSTALVPGDVVLLAAGDKVPADLRLLRARELRSVEAALTGESTPVAKRAATLPPDTPLAERVNLAYAGTVVVGGAGCGIVVATGDATETGHISRLIAAAPDLATPLTRQMAAFSNWLLLVIGGIALFAFAVGLWRGEPAFDMFMAAVALAVGAIPEGLPAALTITLAIGVARMAKRRAIIRKLPAVETLGSTTVICSDKTGTLTENQMTVRAICAGGACHAVSGSGYAPVGEIAAGAAPGASCESGDSGEPRAFADPAAAGSPAASAAVVGALRECLLAGALCNDAGLRRAGRHWEIAGDPTEGALLVAARKGGLDEAALQQRYPRRDEVPFASARQYMATLHEIDGVRVAYVKGALEQILARATARLDAAGVAQPLDASAVAGIEAEAEALAAQGLRVLALARRVGVPAGALENTLENALENALAAAPGAAGGGLEFIGLVGMIDPPRPQAVAAVRTCHAAGIAVKMITGDHAATALAIARQLGIAGPGDAVLGGRELAALDDDALRGVARTVKVFARVEPEQKLRLVRALQADGEVVAMTGDGVNDAPALKQADIGIAMGLAGTEVAKEAADMVLTDDDFAAIEAAVEEGRGVYDNLVKFVTWTLPTNFGEGLLILAAIVAGATLPITPLQILWINMTTAVCLGLMLAFEPIERDVMRRAPRPPGAAILDGALLWRIALVGLLLLGGAYGLFLRELALGSSLPEARTVAVNVFVVVEAFYLFNCRSLTRPVWTLGLFSNRMLWGGLAAMAALQLLLTYVPLLNRLFATAPIGARPWLEIFAVGLLALLVVGAEKHIRSRRRRRGAA